MSIFFCKGFFSRVHATLHSALSVRRSVGRSVGRLVGWLVAVLYKIVCFLRAKFFMLYLPVGNAYDFRVNFCVNFTPIQLYPTITDPLLMEFHLLNMHIFCPFNLFSFISYVGYNSFLPITDEICWSPVNPPEQYSSVLAKKQNENKQCV